MSVPAKIRAVCRELIANASLLITVSLCGLCCLPGCKDKTTVISVATSTTKKSTAIRSEKIKDFQERLEHLMESVTYNYSSAGKPDPFQPFLKTAPRISRQTARKQRLEKKLGKPEICATPLECMEVGQLTLVAIVGNDKGKRIAMAQDAAGIGYFLQPGLRVGYRSGRVKEILPDRVIIEEKLEDIRGGPTLQKRILLLHPEGK
jgi:Tfp pilus assembly protein PilP